MNSSDHRERNCPRLAVKARGAPTTDPCIGSFLDFLCRRCGPFFLLQQSTWLIKRFAFRHEAAAAFLVLIEPARSRVHPRASLTGRATDFSLRFQEEGDKRRGRRQSVDRVHRARGCGSTVRGFFPVRSGEGGVSGKWRPGPAARRLSSGTSCAFPAFRPFGGGKVTRAMHDIGRLQMMKPSGVQ